MLQYIRTMLSPIEIPLALVYSAKFNTFYICKYTYLEVMYVRQVFNGIHKLY